MSTKDLIDAALAKKSDKGNTAAALVVATTTDAQAALDLSTANLAVHDDLAVNGQALYVSGDTSPAYSVATAVDPDGFSLTPIRIA